MIYAVIDTNVLVAAAKSHKPDSNDRVADECRDYQINLMIVILHQLGAVFR